jgi:hypothetical protein
LSSLVLYDNAANFTVRTISFTAGGTPVNVTSFSVLVIDPVGASTTYTQASPQVSNPETGTYNLKIPTSPSVAGSYGLWNVIWVPVYTTGNLDEYIQTDSFRTFPTSDALTGAQYWYCGKEELKSRLNIATTDTASDYEIVFAIQTVMGWINDYCARHFYQVTETRTFAPVSGVWELPVDDLVSTPSVVENTQVNLDYQGNGSYNVSWVYGVNYQLKLGTPQNSENNYNINSTGVALPYTQLQVLQGNPGENNAQGGGWLPFVWPFTNYNRVQIIGTWGWNAVPPQVSMAALILATDFFKMKDSFYGMQGMGDLGIAKVGSNPYLVELLRPFIKFRKKVGV